MNYRFKKFLVFSVLSFFIYYLFSSLYMYFFDLNPPSIVYSGIVDDKYYSGNINVSVTATDLYKVKSLIIKVDDKVLLNNQSVNSQKVEFPLLIPSIHLENGMHTMSITAVDGSKNENKSTEIIHFGVDNEPLDIAICDLSESKINQGSVLHIQMKSNKIIKSGYAKSLGYKVPIVLESPCSTVYECFLPISTEEIPGRYLAHISIEDDVGNISTSEYAYEVLQVNFKKQYIQLKNKKSDFSSFDSSISNDFNLKLKESSEESPPKKLWQGSFYRPCMDGHISSEFGVIRTSFERGRYRHDAIDICAPPKSPVWACQSGVVILKEEDNKVFGNVIAVDHGVGLISLYGHLYSLSSVEVGQSIKKGQILGTVGMTGYATGYHLHWELRLQDVKINPLEWIKNDL